MMKVDNYLRCLLVLLLLIPNNLEVKRYNFDFVLHLPVKVCNLISRNLMFRPLGNVK